MDCYNAYIVGFVAGVAVQFGFTVAILLYNEFRERRQRREREEIEKMLRSAIPASISTYGV